MAESPPYRHSHSRRPRSDYDRYSSYNAPSKTRSTRYLTHDDEGKRSRIPPPPPSPPPSNSSSYSRRSRPRSERHYDDSRSTKREQLPKRYRRSSRERDDTARHLRERGDARKQHRPRERSRDRTRERRRRSESIGGVLFMAFLLGLFYLVRRPGRKTRRRNMATQPMAYPETGSARTIIEDEDTEVSWDSSDSDSDSDMNDEDGVSMMTGAIPVARAAAVHGIPYQPGQPLVFPVLNIDIEDPAVHPARGEGSNGPDRECAVCGEEQPANEFIQQITSRCEHDVSTCRTCLGHWIRTSLQSRAWNEVRCAECREICDYEDMVRIAPLDIVEAITSQSVRTVLSHIPNFYWCTSPRCESGQIHEPDGPIMTCYDCQSRSCVFHNVPWHEGESCAEYTYRHSPRQRRREERASEKLVSRIAKTCPGPGCGARIQKNNGCDHMTCRQCRHEFCWVCLAAYDRIRAEGNMAHASTCRYHAMNF